MLSLLEISLQLLTHCIIQLQFEFLTAEVDGLVFSFCNGFICESYFEGVFTFGLIDLFWRLLRRHMRIVYNRLFITVFFFVRKWLLLLFSGTLHFLFQLRLREDHVDHFVIFAEDELSVKHLVSGS